MSIFSGFDIAMMAKGIEVRQRGGYRIKVFDWNKAVQLIKENNIKNAYAGLEEDWSATKGMILEDGKPTSEGYDTHEEFGYYFSSTWATPVLNDGDKDYECWSYEDELNNNGWDNTTWWPKESLEKYENE